MTENRGYHAHVYYNAETKAKAAKLSATLIAKSKVEGGALSDEPRGPHPISNVLLVFKPDQFVHVVPHLMLNRDGLDVLVHPLTLDAVADHSDFAIWLGNPVKLRLERLPHGRGGRLPSV